MMYPEPAKSSFINPASSVVLGYDFPGCKPGETDFYHVLFQTLREAYTKHNKERMAKFEGLPLNAAIAKIGEPIDERWVAGKKVYIWGSLVEQPTKGSKQCQIRALMNGGRYRVVRLSRR
jgi:hypothetical protein